MPHKLAIIGYGKIAQDQHLPAIATSTAFTLDAVVSRHAKTVPGVEKVFASEEDLYAQASDVDCVSVCGAPHTRYDTARRAILAGRHVLLEKPPAATLTQAHALADLAKLKGVSLFATWHARENDAVDEAARRLRDATVKSIAVTWKEDVRQWHPGQDWVFGAGGFGVFDPGINALSIVTAILPQPIFVRSAKLSIPSNRQGPIAAELSFGGPNDAETLSAVFDWRETGPQTWDIVVTAADGRILRLSAGGARLDVDGAEVFATLGDVEYPRLYARFADLLDRGGSDVDLRPLQLVADAFLLAERTTAEPFAF